MVVAAKVYVATVELTWLPKYVRHVINGVKS